MRLKLLAIAAWIVATVNLTMPVYAVSLGDADCSGNVSAVDARYVLAYEAGFMGPPPCASAADVNLDGLVNPVDALLILQLEAGLIESLPV